MGEYRTLIRSITGHITDFIVPLKCVGCKTLSTILCNQCKTRLFDECESCLFCKTAVGRGVCRTCTRTLYLSSIVSATSYKHQLAKTIITQYKYHGVRSLAGVMASMMTNALGASGGALHHPLVIPIPLHRLKERRRGFNQSELLAALIAKTASLPKIEKNVFVRTRKSPPQVTAASADEREKQVRGVFIVRDDTPIRGRDILLIDDVATTGATLKEAAKTLKNGGAENIHALIFARG